MAANSPYDTAVAATAGITNSWFFRDLTGVTATATAGAVSGTYTGAVGLQVVSPLAQDSSTPLGGNGDVLGAIHLGATTGPAATTAGYVTFGDNFDFPTATPFSATALIRLRGDQPANYVWAEMEILDKTPTASRNGWDVAVTANKQIIFRRWVAGVAESVTHTQVLIPQVWYFIAVTYDGTTLRVYLDDYGSVSAASVGSLPGNAVNFTVGGQNGGSTALLDGDVGPVALYNRALSNAEVSTLFRAAFVAGTVSGFPTHTYYFHPTGNDSTGTGAIGNPWQSWFKAASTAQAGDTCIFQYASGTPYVETQVRSNSCMAYSGTKRSGITFTSDQTIPARIPTSADHMPHIVFGTLSTGTAVNAVTGASWSASNGGQTTYTVNNSLTAGISYVTVTGASPSGYNVSDALVIARSGTTVTIAMAANPGTWSSGGTMVTGIDLSNAQKSHILQQCYHTIQGLWFDQPMAGSDYNDRLIAFFGQQYPTSVNTVTAGTVSSGIVTYTTPANHGLIAGRTVNVSGLGSSGGSYNFTNGSILTVPSGTTFTVAVATATGTPSGTGWLTAEMQGEVQTITVSAGASGNWTATLPGNSAATALSPTITAAALQTALRATTSTLAAGAGPLTNVNVTGGPGGTAALIIVFNSQQQNPYAVGPMPLFTTTPPATSGTATPARTTAGTNGTRWYQSADFCTAQYLRITNGYQPYKSAVDTGSVFQYNLVEGCNVAIGCFNSNAPTFQGNLFLMNGTGQPLRNGGILGQADGIQSKGGTRNAQIYNNVVRVPVGGTPLTGAAYYIGGGSNDMNGLYDNSTSGKEGYNNVCFNNVAIAEYPDGIAYAGFAIQGGANDTIANNVAINCTVSSRILAGGQWPTMGALSPPSPKVDAPTIVNNIWYRSPVYVGSTTSITESSTTGTYTVPNTLLAGQLVTVRGAFPDGYNVSSAAISTPTGANFQITGLASGLTSPATTQGAVYTSVGYGFKWGTSQANDLGSGAVVYANNMRYYMGFVDDTITTNPPTNEVGANASDPLFYNYLTDWHTLPGSPISRAGQFTTRTAFGQGYLAKAALDMSLDYVGDKRQLTPDLGIYASSVGGETLVSVQPVSSSSTVAGVETFNVGTGLIGTGREVLRQGMVLTDPNDIGLIARVLATDPSYSDMGSVVRALPARSSTATVTSVASSATSITLLAANSAAKGRMVFNNSTQTLYLKFGITASTSSFTVALAASGYYEFPTPLYTGRVDAIWASANGAALVTEES